MTISIRRASTTDIPHMAHFTIDAWCGFAHVMYENAIPGRTLQEIVEHRFSRSGTTANIENSLVFEEGGSVMGGTHAYPMDNEATDPEDILINPEHMADLALFEHMHVAGSYHIDTVAVYPEYRGRGIARQLVGKAETEAASKGFNLMSLFVFEANRAARHLYESIGYREHIRQPCFPHPSMRYEGDVLIMTRSL